MIDKNEMRGDSGPVGYPINLRPEIGLSIEQHFRAKHQRGEFGKYFPLHTTSTQAFRRPMPRTTQG